MRLAVCRNLVVAMLFSFAACGEADPERVAEPMPADTVADIQPRSPAEIEQHAEPMTPERAEELGVVDTTIQVTEEP
jgi:predicted small lipoprotein YifL